MTEAATATEVARLYDSWARSYDDEYQSREETRAEDDLVLRWIEEDVLIRDTFIYDAGCGTGWLLDHLPIHPEQYLGFDVSPGMVERARTKHPGYPLHVADVLDTWPDAETPEYGTTALLMWAVMNHVPPRYLDVPYVRAREAGVERVVTLTRTPHAPGFAQVSEHQHDAALARVLWHYPHDSLLRAATGGGFSVIEQAGFLYGGEVVSPERAHYVWTEAVR